MFENTKFSDSLSPWFVKALRQTGHSYAVLAPVLILGLYQLYTAGAWLESSRRNPWPPPLFIGIIPVCAVSILMLTARPFQVLVSKHFLDFSPFQPGEFLSGLLKLWLIMSGIVFACAFPFLIFTVCMFPENILNLFCVLASAALVPLALLFVSGFGSGKAIRIDGIAVLLAFFYVFQDVSAFLSFSVCVMVTAYTGLVFLQGLRPEAADRELVPGIAQLVLAAAGILYFCFPGSWRCGVQSYCLTGIAAAGAASSFGSAARPLTARRLRCVSGRGKAMRVLLFCLSGNSAGRIVPCLILFCIPAVTAPDSVFTGICALFFLAVFPAVYFARRKNGRPEIYSLMLAVSAVLLVLVCGIAGLFLNTDAAFQWGGAIAAALSAVCMGFGFRRFRHDWGEFMK